MKRTRLKPEARKEDILAAAVPLAVKLGYSNVSREKIAEAAGVSGAVLNYHFGTMLQFRRDLMRYAIKQKALAIIAQGLSSGDAQAVKAPEDLRRLALDSLMRA